MIPFYDAAAIREADRLAAERFGFSPALLMENAGRGAAEALLRLYGRRNWTILCGPGNNGGDGFVAARHLALAGCGVEVFLSEERSRLRSLPAANLSLLEAMGCSVFQVGELDDCFLADRFEKSGGILDALLGTGARGALRGETPRLLRFLPEKGPVKVSLDVPTGVDASDGTVDSQAFRADLTLTFLAPKNGLRIMPGAAYAGKLGIIDLGIEKNLLLSSPSIEGYGIEDAAGDWPPVSFGEHKGKKGTVLILGGSSTYRGAPVLAARAALRAGAGLVVLIVPECIAKSASMSLPETIVLSASKEDEGGVDFESAVGLLSEWSERADALVFGPGAGRVASTRLLMEWIAASWRKPLLLDADSLFFLAGKVSTSRSLITPHEGEAARLLGETSTTVAARRLESACSLARRFGTVLLKGPYSICCDGNRTGFALESSPALAVPGSGDVLSGIAGTLLAKGLSPWRAGLAAAWTHARAGSILSSDRRTEAGFLASEIADALQAVLGELSSFSKDQGSDFDANLL